jgi:hypothetical protein
MRLTCTKMIFMQVLVIFGILRMVNGFMIYPKEHYR